MLTAVRTIRLGLAAMDRKRDADIAYLFTEYNLRYKDCKCGCNNDNR